MRVRHALVLGVCVLVALFSVTAVRPATVMATQSITVNTDQDGPPIDNDDFCSLRSAIIVSLANNNVDDVDCTPGLTGIEPDVIQIDPTLTGHTLTLGSPLPTISGDANNAIKIIGPTIHASDFLISGGNAHRILELGTTTLTLDNLTITAGNGAGTVGSGDGGAIWAQGTIHLTLNNVFITDSHVPGRGGAIFVQGVATLTNNGGAYVGNSASGKGGAIFGFQGPITYNGYAMLMNGNVSGDKGGAIALIADPRADFTHIERSLLMNNAAPNGGVFYSEPTLDSTTDRTTFELTDSTVTGNSSVFFSLDSLEAFTYARDTFVNTGSLFSNAGYGHIFNSIIIGGTCNTIGDIHHFTGSRNLITPHSPIHDGCMLHNDPEFSPVDSLGLDPTGVSPTLAQNGGPEVQQTFRLSAGSNAIDNGDPAYCGTIDARSIPRGINGVGASDSPERGDCDIGAYEYAPYVANFVTGVNSVNEADGSTNVEVKLSIPDPADSPLLAPLFIPVTAAVDSTARNPQDYTLDSPFVIFPIGSVNGAIEDVAVGITQNDVAGRYDKHVNLKLGSAGGVFIAEPKTHEVSITDDDRPGVVANDGGTVTTVSEATPDTADSFSIALQSQPDCIQTDPDDQFSCGDPADVTVHAEPDRDCTITLGGNPGSLGSPADFLVANADWRTGAPITVKAVDDLYDEDLRDETVTHKCRITFTFSSGDPLYNATSDVYDVTVHDNDVAGVTLVADPANGDIPEGSLDTNTYTLVLDTPPDPGKPLPSTPRGPTIVTVTPNAACTVGNGAGVAKGFSFTDDNWDAPQTVTISPVDNETVELLHGCTLATTITSPDPVYQDQGNSPSLLPALSGFSIQDYAPTDVTNDPPFIDVTTTGGSGSLSVSEVTPSTADTLSFVFERRPLSDVTINLSASNDPRITSPQVLFKSASDVSPGATTSITFTKDNWNVPQVVKVFAKDDDYDESEGLNPVHISANVTTSAAGFNDSSLRRFVLDATDPAVLLTVPVSITDNDTSAVNVTESSGSTDVTEGGATDSLSLVLATHPYDNVKLDVSTGAQCKATFDGASGDGHELTIAAADWATPVALTVTAVNDLVVETSPKNCAISFVAQSSDGLYDAISIPDVTATVTDNDTAKVLITTVDGIAVSEATPATADSYDVVLSGQPDANVTIHVAVADGQTRVYSTGSPANSVDLLFTPANYDSPQTVHVVAVDDHVIETSPHTGTIAHSIVTAATGFAAAPITVDAASTSSISADVTDDDVVSVRITTSGGIAVSEASPSTADTYQVVLGAKPDANVTVHVEVADGQTQVYSTGAPASSVDLLFTPADSDTPQTVHVVAVDDLILEANPHPGTISHSIVTTATDYAAAPVTVDGANTSDITASITDNDGVSTLTASFVKSTAGGLAPLDVDFDASASSGPAEIVSYRWFFGDGTTGTGLTVSHQFVNPGRYFVKLKIRDANGLVAVVKQAVHVYRFSWITPLVDAPGMNRAVAGSNIRLRFSTGGYSGFDIREVRSPLVQKVDCDTGEPIPGTSFTAKHFGISALTYTPHGQIYTFRWRSVARWAGSCREFDLTLAGGITRSVIFNFAPPG